MAFPVTRRAFLKTSGLLAGAAALPFGAMNPAFAARERITLRIARDFQSLDPANRVSYIEEGIIRACTQKLIAFKKGQFEWELDAAKSIEKVSQTEITFELKPGQMFTGGYGEMTAEDVKFSFERFATAGPDGKKSEYASDWAALDKVEVTGKYTGKILLTKPAPSLWLTTLPDGSGTIISKKAFTELGDKVKTTLIGSGPYQIAEWVPNQKIVLRANPDYKGPKPSFNEVVLRPIADPKTAELAFRANELDFTVIEPASAKEFEKIAGTKVINLDSINFVWIGMNVEKAPLNDIKVREAIRKAIDVDEVVLAAFNGAVKPARSIIAPGLLGYWKDAPVYKRDVAGAKKLLAEAGVKPGTKLKLTLLNRPAYQTAGVVIQAMLQEVGIDLTLEVLDGGAFWSVGKGEAGKNLELSLQRFGGKADPAFHTQWFVKEQIGVWNWQRWDSPEFDKIYNDAASASAVARRNELYIELQKVMDKSAAFIWLTHEANVFATKQWLDPAILPNGDDLQYSLFKEV
jgi:peptide/nickel transport system substrate-binding protein